MSEKKAGTLLEGPLKVVNIGLEGFARELEDQGVEVIQVDWTPPAGGDPRLADLLSKLGS
jgi:FdrA protein